MIVEQTKLNFKFVNDTPLFLKKCSCCHNLLNALQMDKFREKKLLILSPSVITHTVRALDSSKGAAAVATG